jgi:hypothetical protein
MRPQAVIQMSVQRLACTACGAEAHASCNCGKPYVPAKQRAGEAIAANPRKSDRAIAADLGIGHATVSRARETVSGGTVEPRVGIDGKARRLPSRHEPDDDQPTDEEFAVQQFNFAADSVIVTATDALSYVKRMKVGEQHAASLVKVVDQIIAQWGAVKEALGKGAAR